MSAVIGADADDVQLLGLQHGLVIRVETDSGYPELFKERFRFAGNQIGGSDDLHIRAAQITDNVSLRDPAHADDTDFKLGALVADGTGGLLFFKTICNT